MASVISLLRLASILFLLVHPSLSATDDVDFIFNGFQQASGLILDGSASVLHGGALQLNDGSNDHVIGRAFFDSPVRMVENRSGDVPTVVSFSTTFVFDVVPEGSSDGGGGGGCHGLAFVVAPSKEKDAEESFLGNLAGPITDSQSSHHVFAIEFDIMSVIKASNETNCNHVDVSEVGTNSLVFDVPEPAAYHTNDDKTVAIAVPLKSGKPIQAWVDYNGITHTLNVAIAPVPVPGQPHRPLMSTTLDTLPIFSEDMYVGFSSAREKLAMSSAHILAWSLRTNGVAQSIELSKLPIVSRPPSSPSLEFVIIDIAKQLACGATVLASAAAMSVFFLD